MKRSKISKGSSSSESSLLLNLPSELLTSIAVSLAKDNIDDVVSLSKTCVDCRGLCREGAVLKSASMDKFIMDKSMSREKERFFNLCIRQGNPDAMFRKGMFLFFKYLHTGLAKTTLLVRFAALGFRPAIYAICLIHLSGIHTFTTDSLSTLQFSDCLQLFQSLRNDKRVIECRRAILLFFSIKHFISNDAIQARNYLCIGRDCKFHWRPANGNWFFIDEEDDLNSPDDCLRCRLDHEIQWFKNIIERRHSNWGRLAWKPRSLDFDCM